MKHLDTVSDADIVAFNIPTGAPLVYEVGERLRRTTRYYLGDRAAMEVKARAVAEQGKARA